MNLFKVYSALVILLVLCTYDAEGGIILLLLLKIIALKGALFFGMPLAIGSFMMGQGMGFFGGTMFGGYSMLNAAHKYSKSQVPKLKGHHHHAHHPISHVTYGPPSHGWGWGDDTKHSYVTSTSDIEYGTNPQTHFHHYRRSQPSLFSKISSIPSRIVDTFRLRRPHKGRPHGHSHVSYKSPVYSEQGKYTHQSSYGGHDPLHTYYDHADDTSNKYSGSNAGEVDWNQGLANLLKAAELANTLPASHGDDYGHDHGHDHSSSSAGGYSSSYENEPPSKYQPSSTYEDPSPGKYESSAPAYDTPDSGPAAGVDMLPPSDTVNSDYSSYANSPTIQEPSSQYGYTVNHNHGAEQSPVSSYSQEPSYPVPEDSQPAYPDSQPAYPNLYSNSHNYDGVGQESEESVKKVRAPNSIIEKYLEMKLKDEMLKQKNQAQRKEAAQLIAMLRQVYIQELVDSLNPQDRKSRGTAHRSTTELPEFVPFPVPNSTTAKPKFKMQVSTLIPSQSSKVKGDQDVESTTKHVRIRTPTKATTTTPASTTSTSTSTTTTTSTPNPITSSGPVSEPTRFIRMKTSFVLNKRQLDRRSNPNPVRTRRQNSPMEIQALSTFTDDIKKFFLLVSILDQDKCLQKLVCDVHTRADKDNLTPYETNIVITFKVMNAMISMDTEDSTLNYRKAAKIGELSRQAQVCIKAYPSCSYSPTEIIGMGNLVAATGSVDSVTTNAPPTDQESAGSEIHAQIVTKTPVTVMPRV